jgi:transcriptional regulator with XRE-family HTH domain
MRPVCGNHAHSVSSALASWLRPRSDRNQLNRADRENHSLKQLRIIRGVSQSQLATRLGLNQQALARLESRTDVSISVLRRFVEALGGRIEISAIFSDMKIGISGLTTTETLEHLDALINRWCRIYPKLPEAGDEFILTGVDESVIRLDSVATQQRVEIPLHRVSEVITTVGDLPTIVIRDDQGGFSQS